MSEPALRICTTCDIPHYENCPKCFGFGHRVNGGIVSAGEATRGAIPLDDVLPCPYCKSTVRGVPPADQHDPK